jgi:hypothetical protein
MTPATITPLPPIPPEVQAFAQEKGVAPYFPGVIELARDIFPESRLTLALYDDPEIDGWRQISLRVEILEPKVRGGWLAAYRRWSGEIINVCPKELAHVFTLYIVE